MQRPAVCELGIEPVLIGGLLRDVLIRHFQAGNIQRSPLRNSIWRKGTASKILIETVYRYKPETGGLRPAVLLRQDGYTNMKLAIGDLSTHDSLGNPIRSTMWVGSHTLFCLAAESGFSAGLLATEVSGVVTGFSEAICRQVGLFNLSVARVSPISRLKESLSTYAVALTIAWAYEENWRVEQEAPRLSRVKLSTLLSD